MSVSQTTPGDNILAYFEAHMAGYSGPTWLRELKQRHWQDFTTLPMPTRRDEKWRFTKLRHLALPELSPTQVDIPSVSELPGSLVEAPALRLVFIDNRLVSREGSLPDGVEVLNLEEAIGHYPELVQEHLETRHAKLGMDKFFALHMSLLEDLVLVRAEPGASLSRPIEITCLKSENATMQTPHVLIEAGANSDLTVVETHGGLSGASAGAEGLAISSGTVHAGDSSRIRRLLVQNHALTTKVFHNEESICGRDAYINNLQVNLGGSYSRFEGHSVAAGSGADVHLYSMAAAVGSQVFDQRTLQTHQAPNSRSDLLFKNALLDTAQTIFSGMIFVEEAAQQTDAYQTNRNLLLSPIAETNSLPGLEINANDVKCSHGATTGQVSPEEMFYLNARGIPRRKAFELLVFGFFEEILDKIDDDPVHEKLSAMVASKFSA